MSLLDKLKKKAEIIKEKELEDDDTTITTVSDKLRKENAVILDKKLDFIHKYLTELVENLNIIKPENEITYNLIDKRQAHFDIKRVKKTNFSVHKGKSENGNRVFLKYDLYSDKGLSIKVVNDPKLPVIRKHLSEKHLKYFETDVGSDLVEITLANPVSSRLIYAADLDHCMIVLNRDNVEGPWSKLVKYLPEDITEQLMDETAKYLLGEENEFKKLSGKSVSDKTIMQLREHLPE
jgi:hypothetical protein